MENKSTFDRGFILPVVIAVFSIFGICLVLLLARLSAFRAVEVVEPTGTPFKYLFLGTEPGISTTTPEEDGETPPLTEEPITFASPTSLFDDFPPPSEPTEVSPTEGTPIATTPAPSSNAPLNPGTYDQNDSRIAYTGDWVPQNGVTGVFQNTLIVSNTLGNTVTLRFIGEQIRIFYQSGSGLGTIRINMDGVQFDLDQSNNSTAGAEWVSPLLINGTHTVTITHLSGGSINLDSFIVPDPLKTPTPTNSN